jgi:hypothetical protein
MLAEQLLLLLGGKVDVPFRIRSRALASGISIKSAGELARAALEHGGDAIALVGSGDRWYLGHKIEVEKLDKLELDLTSCGPRLEE